MVKSTQSGDFRILFFFFFSFASLMLSLKLILQSLWMHWENLAKWSSTNCMAPCECISQTSTVDFSICRSYISILEVLSSSYNPLEKETNHPLEKHLLSCLSVICQGGCGSRSRASCPLKRDTVPQMAPDGQTSALHSR